MNHQFVLNDGVSLVGATEGEFAHFFGYHDVSPWDPLNRQIIVHRLPSGVMDYTGRSVSADVCLWTPTNGEIRSVGRTAAWSWEQASRAQWRGKRGTLIFNVLRDSGDAVGVEVDVDTGDRHELPASVYSISSDGRWAMTPHFGRLWRYWKSYGYDCRLPASIEQVAPSDDGIFLLDLDKGSVRLTFSVQQAVETDPVPSPADTPHFLAHPTFSPSGERFAVLHRFASKDRSLFTRLFVCNQDGGDARILAREKVSHFEWLDDHRIIVWARQTSPLLTNARSSGISALPLARNLVRLLRKLSPDLKQRMLNEYYYVFDVRGNEAPQRFGPDALDQDGHPQVSPNGKWIVTDTYADPSGYQSLILFDVESEQRIDVGKFHLPEAFRKKLLKSDLHPRWDRSGNLLCIDSAHSGQRQMYVLDVSSLVH